jgi:hypothetical protein
MRLMTWRAIRVSIGPWPPAYKPVAELARPELKLAGLRIDESQNSRSRMAGNTGMAIGPLPTTEAGRSGLHHTNALGPDG